MRANRREMPRAMEVSLKCLTCGKEFKSWQSSRRRFCSQRCASDNAEAKTQRVAAFNARTNKVRTYSRAVKGWLEIGGKRIFCQSRWESNYACYLQWMKERGLIVEWEYEPQTFWFEKIRRGVRSYLPDFKVTMPNGGHEWHEVKGWMDARSKTKIRRMAKYHPKEVLRVFGAEWFKDASRKLSAIVPGWTAGKRRSDV